MEWVETTGKTVEEAKDAALDRLGVDVADAEFEIVEEPRPGLFGRVRGEARVRARVRPSQPRPKLERKRRGGRREAGAERGDRPTPGAPLDDDVVGAGDSDDEAEATSSPRPRPSSGRRDRPAGTRPPRAAGPPTERNGDRDDAGDDQGEPVSPAAVGEAAVAFMQGLAEAFGGTATTELSVEGNDLEVRVIGTDLGLLIGPAGRTLSAVQDLARVAAQRRLGDHDTRLRVDVAGYRQRRRAALERFAGEVAEQVKASGVARALEPMQSADRKVIHDTLHDLDGVASHSEGEEPARRVVVTPTT